MPKLKKFLSKFSRQEREIVEILIEKILSLNLADLDIRKLKGHQDVFRARKGTIRIIFKKKDKDIRILTIERRSDKTYKRLK